jgi:capsular polysaccharide biosynthesis protein
MGPLDYLRILRRRWWFLALTAVVGLSLAVVTSPSTRGSATSSQPSRSYRASNLLISNPLSVQDNRRTVDLDRLALLTVKGVVPDRAIAKLDTARWPTLLGGGSASKDCAPRDKGASTATKRAAGCEDSSAKKKSGAGTSIRKRRNKTGDTLLLGFGGRTSVTALPDPSTQSLEVQAKSPNRDLAVTVANTFASELLTYVNQAGKVQYQRDLEQAQAGKAAAEARLASASAQLIGAPPAAVPTLTAERNSAMTEIASRQSEIDQITQAGPDRSNLQTLEKATADNAAFSETAGSTVTSPAQRMAFGAGLGLLLGIGALLLIELLSARVRDVQGAEGAARMPVIAEIPVVKLPAGERFSVASAQDPSSLIAEAYRSLRTSLLAMWQRHPRNVARSTTTATATATGTGTASGRCACCSSPRRARPRASPSPR